jgi:hypothetical protein
MFDEIAGVDFVWFEDGRRFIDSLNGRLERMQPPDIICHVSLHKALLQKQGRNEGLMTKGYDVSRFGGSVWRGNVVRCGCSTGCLFRTVVVYWSKFTVGPFPSSEASRRRERCTELCGAVDTWRKLV